MFVLDWGRIGAQLDEEGYALIPGLLRADPALMALTLDGLRRAPLGAAGQGRLHYFPSALPPALAALSAACHAPLEAIANRWNARLGQPHRYRLSSQAPVSQAQMSHLTELYQSDYMGLHPGTNGAAGFPLQLAGLLSMPGEDFTGGELVLVEQRPRKQSRPMVVPLRQGDAAILCGGLRPCQGKRADYRVSIKQAISPVRSGRRLGLTLHFHDGAAEVCSGLLEKGRA
ncbi:prolyl 4-hydroxylase [Bordetella avium]|nr:prolyl 4-hydroxylase [Bordetella avium]RIQ30331.1 prolyl 4-hydroxylase [Bordetella avium]